MSPVLRSRCFVSGATALLLLASGLAMAQSAILPYREYAKRTDAAQKVGPLTDAAFGANISLYNGSTSFRAVDISLSGNSGLPVQLARTLDIDDRTSDFRPTTGGFADWQLDVPYIDGTFIGPVGWKVGSGSGSTSRCSNTVEPTMSGTWQLEDIWHGYNLHVPDATSEQLLINNVAGVPNPTDGQSYPWLTKSGFRIRCLSSLASGSGEGYLAVGPDGTKYWFNWMVSKALSPMRNPLLVNIVHATPRDRIFLFATRVEDRHGNWVTYSYTGDKLTQIAANDGRSITLAWSGDRVVSATAAGKTWQYQYQAGGAANYALGPGLMRVVLPDGSDWLYSATGSLKHVEQWQPSFEGPSGTCSDLWPPEQIFGYTVKHPAGASASYSFEAKRHIRTRIIWICESNEQTPLEELAVPNFADVISLVSRTVSGPGITPKTWTYEYGEPNSSSFSYPPVSPGGAWYVPSPRDACVPGVPCAPEDDAKYVTETESTGRVKRYTFGTGLDKNEGRLLAEEVLSAGVVVRRTAYTFITDAEVATQPFTSSIGGNLQMWQPLATLVRPVRHTVITQQGKTFASYTNAFDAFARATSVSEVTTDAGTGVPEPARTELTTYHDYKPTWTVGLPKSKQYSGRPELVYELFYPNPNALPSELRSFGRIAETYTYNADGTLATVKDARNHTTTLSNWYRGVPRTVSFPDATSVSATVDSYGSITSVTDELGFSTSYSHDAMGRVSQITYPTGDTVAWAPTTVSFVPVAAVEYGLPAGHWRQITSRGNYRKETYFDGLWRPVLEREYDNAAATATQRFKGWQYDMDGQVTFAGYPRATATSVASFTQGVTNTYDDLGRPTRVRQHSELGNLDTVYAYLSGFETQVTNPRGQSTTTNFQTFAQPDTSAPVLIEAPAGQVTTIARDVYGSPTVLNRQGVWSGSPLSVSRHYIYDTHRRLCASVEPETGATVMDYDAASNVTWSAAGIASPNLSSPTACIDARTVANASGRRVDRVYDARNRVTALSFPDGRGNQTFTYTPDGLPNQVTTNNSAGGTTVVNGYTYNRRRMMTAETMNQVGWYTWGLGYAYDTLGNLVSQSYPTGLSVGYAPNALGQATQAGSYATGVQYFPNGAIKQFTYGNGLVHTLTQNARQLPLASIDTGGALSQQYAYDANGNVSSVTDSLDAARSKTMGYDALDRLTSATSTSFGGNGLHQFAYDPLDNLRSWKLAGVKDLANYVYSADNRLTEVRNSAGGLVHQFSYDLQGNITSRNAVPHDFDFGNRLRAVPGIETYRYDGSGRRVQTTKASGATTLWMYAQNGQMLFSSKLPVGGGQTTHENVYLGGSLVATIDHNWPSNAIIATKYQHTDALGSPVAMSNESGAVIERTNYDPYGGAIGKVVDGIGYTGHVMDPATGLTYMQQRYYDQGVGRFLSVDPVTALDTGDMRHLNRYAYGFNNPYKFTDPDGRTPVHAAGAVIGGVVGFIGGGVVSAISSGGDLKKTFAGAVGGAVGGVITGGTLGAASPAAAVAAAAVTGGILGEVTSQTVTNAMEHGGEVSEYQYDGGQVAMAGVAGFVSPAAKGLVDEVAMAAQKKLAPATAEVVTEAAAAPIDVAREVVLDRKPDQH
ncbi:MAG: RHS repeat protein [Arenimonas sp.]|nr:RHS repeat protein [Arenimonas sp.]